MFEELEVVELAHDIKEHNLKEGVRGTIVEIYKNGEAYEVEFITSNGRTSILLTLMPNDIHPAMNQDLYHGLNVSVRLSTASGTVSPEHHTSNEELMFNMDTPKSKANTEEFRYPISML